MTYYIDMFKSSEVTLNLYKNSKSEFQTLKKWQRVVLAVKHPKLMLAMLEDGDELDVLTKPFGKNEELAADYRVELGLIYQEPFTHFFDSKYVSKRVISEESKLKNDLQYHSATELSVLKTESEEVALSVYNKVHIISTLSESEQIEIVLLYPVLTKRFVEEGRIKNLSDKKFSFFVTCLCVNAARSTYGANLSGVERNELCVEIAKQPELMTKLLPAARILLLARLKRIQSSQKTSLSQLVQEVSQHAYDLPVEWDQFEAFWLPTITGMSYENDYIGRFSDVLDCALRRYNYANAPLVESEALALAVVLDARFEKGFANQRYPEHPYARLQIKDREKLIAQYTLDEKIKAYHALTDGLKLQLQEAEHLKKEEDHKRAEALEKKQEEELRKQEEELKKKQEELRRQEEEVRKHEEEDASRVREEEARKIAELRKQEQEEELDRNQSSVTMNYSFDMQRNTVSEKQSSRKVSSTLREKCSII